MIALMIQGIWKLEYQWRWDFGRNGAKFPLWRSCCERPNRGESLNASEYATTDAQAALRSWYWLSAILHICG